MYKHPTQLSNIKFSQQINVMKCSSTCAGVLRSSPGKLSEELVTQKKRKKGWRMNCQVGEVTEGLENEL